MPRPSVREKLIVAGMRTLHAQGFNGCGVQDITSAAGVPKGSFYNHFESKEALAVEALDRFWQSGSSRRAALMDREVDPVDRLRQYFGGMADAIVQHKFQRGCMIGNFSTEMSGQSDAVRNRLVELYEDWAACLRACVADAEQAGRLRSGLSADVVASYLVNAWEGAVLRSKVERNRTPFDRFEEVIFATVFN